MKTMEKFASDFFVSIKLWVEPVLQQLADKVKDLEENTLVAHTGTKNQIALLEQRHEEQLAALEEKVANINLKDAAEEAVAKLMPIFVPDQEPDPVQPDDFEKKIKEHVEYYVDKVVEDAKDGDDGIDGRDGKDGAPGRDGLDGTDGKDGESVDVELLERQIRESVGYAVSEAVASLPVPRDGTDGRDGKDGRDALQQVDPDSLNRSVRGVVQELMPTFVLDGRTLTIKDQEGEHTVSFDQMIYRGIYRDTDHYVKGDTVTWGGSLWHCNEPTAEKPGDGKLWTLCAKKGRDAK